MFRSHSFHSEFGTWLNHRNDLRFTNNCTPSMPTVTAVVRDLETGGGGVSPYASSVTRLGPCGLGPSGLGPYGLGPSGPPDPYGPSPCAGLRGLAGAALPAAACFSKKNSRTNYGIANSSPKGYVIYIYMHMHIYGTFVLVEVHKSNPLSRIPPNAIDCM